MRIKFIFVKRVLSVNRVSMKRLLQALKTWFKSLGGGMSDAVLHPYKDNEPPEIGAQPYSGDPYDSKKGA